MLIDNYEIKESDFSRDLWIVTFENGEEYVCFTLEEIEPQFGDSSNYIVVKGKWVPSEIPSSN